MTPDLYPHQQDAVARLTKGVPTYLGFDMGIGKSRTFIEAANARSAQRVLILCPASAILVWKRELDLWAKGSQVVIARKPEDLVKKRFVIVSHGLLSQRGGALADALANKVAPFDMTCIDEAHAFNASDSLRVKILRKAASTGRLGLAVPLSGTPMKNHAGDLYTLTSVCWPQGLTLVGGKKISRVEFEDMFCVVANRFFGGSPRPVRVIEGSKNLPRLRQLIGPFMLRVRKEEVLKDLPPIKWEPVQVPLDTTHLSQEDHEKLEKFVLGALDGGKTDPDVALSALSGRGPSEAHIMTLRRMLGLAKLKGALEYLTDMLDNLTPDRKVLVFAVHADVIAAIENHLAHFGPVVLTGKSTSAERAKAVDTFLTSPACRVFVGNIQAAGTALTLVGPTCKCSDVVFVESSWTPMDNAQAACRVHRIGQRDGVVARMLSAAGTIDDLIESLLARKAEEFSTLFDAVADAGKTITIHNPQGATT